MGFPTTRDEEWKYTDVKPITRLNFQRAEGKSVTSAEVEKFGFEGLDTYLLVFVNGEFQPSISTADSNKSDILIDSLKNRLVAEDERVSSYINRSTQSAADSFTTLNTAFSEDGALIYIPANKILDKPVHLLYINDAASPNIATPRNLVIAGENSQAQIIESYAGMDKQVYFTNTVSEIIVAQNAHVEHFKIQRESESAFHIGSTFVEQQRDSVYKSHNFVFGGHLVRNNFNTRLADEGIECVLNGLYVGINDQHIDNHTAIDHAMPNCHSEEIYKGILEMRGVRISSKW